MREMQTTGGLTRGRCITDSILAQCVGAVPLRIPICEALEERCEILEQHSLHKDHNELGQTRQTEEDADRNGLVVWLKSHNLFKYIFQVFIYIY